MTSANETASITFRDLEDIDDIRAVEDLQIETWGDDERDVVPLHQFVAARHVGGSLIGAFDGNELVGFAYGFYGHIGGRIVHHSHMLAVRPAYRRHNLGFRLKVEQRERVLADGLTDRITWTFDPLQSLNAHFNFTKLGVVSDIYKVNLYGDVGGSFLHQNGTDRLLVTWLVNSSRVRAAIAGRGTRGNDRPGNMSRLLTYSESGNPEPAADLDAVLADSRLASIEIPADINSIESSDFDLARRWRAETRRAFSEALRAGHVVVDYSFEKAPNGRYVLEKTQLDQLAA